MEQLAQNGMEKGKKAFALLIKTLQTLWATHTLVLKIATFLIFGIPLSPFSPYNKLHQYPQANNRVQANNRTVIIV